MPMFDHVILIVSLKILKSMGGYPCKGHKLVVYVVLSFLSTPTRTTDHHRWEVHSTTDAPWRFLLQQSDVRSALAADALGAALSVSMSRRSVEQRDTRVFDDDSFGMFI